MCTRQSLQMIELLPLFTDTQFSKADCYAQAKLLSLGTNSHHCTSWTQCHARSMRLFKKEAHIAVIRVSTYYRTSKNHQIVRWCVVSKVRPHTHRKLKIPHHTSRHSCVRNHRCMMSGRVHVRLHSIKAFNPHRLKPFHPAESLLHEVGACAQSRVAHNSVSFRAFLRPGDTRGSDSNDARQVCVATSSFLHAMQMLLNLPVPWNTRDHDCDSDYRCVLPSTPFLHKH